MCINNRHHLRKKPVSHVYNTGSEKSLDAVSNFNKNRMQIICKQTVFTDNGF